MEFASVCSGLMGGIAEGAMKMMECSRLKVAVVLIAASLGAETVALSQIVPGAGPVPQGQALATVPPVRMALSKDDIVAGLRQRETSIEDISYRVSTKQFQRGNDQPVDETVVSWMSRDDMFKYEIARKEAGGKSTNTIVAYDGELTRSLGSPNDGGQRKGAVTKTKADRDTDKLNSESYYLRYNGEYYSSIVSKREFTASKVDSAPDGELYLLTGTYSPSLKMAILIDAKKGFYPLKISLWAPSRGHSVEKPTFQYETTKNVLCGQVWLPQECSYQENPLFDHSKEVRISKSFSDVKVNQGLTKEAFSIDWPKGTEVRDRTLNPEPRGNQ